VSYKIANGAFYDAMVTAIRVVGVVQFGSQRIERVPETSISYDVETLEPGLYGALTNLTPVNRVGRNVKINSAAVGTPCKLFAGPDGLKLYLSGEEVPFNLCAPQGR
jgi:hypothetical protein